ncbi:hypothetical protein SAMN05428988_6605 [Chitinophaga sp. YR573]|uniref:hypothetical protein n=1 Tax=Chitinophaga sp. YR573 TaxID=1881040 RepID=UPI0008AAA810|nr:hypothetical protein [Chitinophaga sp. YR573]SEW47111.1 hypothetical protein SAMN05428988_6605 [Chitinophaga sp. YR573]
MIKNGLWGLVILTIISIKANAQSKDEIIGFLTNEDSREWILRRYEEKLGDCSGNGQLFVLFKNGTLRWSRCEKGDSYYKELKWFIQLETSSPLEYKIVFSESLRLAPNRNISEMRIDIVKPCLRQPKVKMIWRSIPANRETRRLMINLISVN